MRLDKWYYSNLESRRDKVYAQELVAAIQKFPPNVMERFPVAIENDKLLGTLDEICHLMSLDGFSQWDCDAVKQSHVNRTILASNWTKLKMLRCVIESGQGAVLTSDNAYPVVPFEVIDETIASCPDDMNALYLHWVADPHEDGIVAKHYKTLSEMKPTGIKGVLGGFRHIGWIAYWTPKGAQTFLDIWKQNPHHDGQEVLFQAECDVQGFYACNPNLCLSIFDIPTIYGTEGVISECENLLVRKDKSWEME